MKLSIRRFHHRLEGEEFPDLPPTHFVPASVDGYPVEPCVERGLKAELSQAFVGLDEYFLCKIVDDLSFIEDREQKISDFFLVAVDEKAEYSLFALLKEGDKDLITLLVERTLHCIARSAPACRRPGRQA